MKSFFKMEINRILRNKMFWIALLIGAILTVSQYFMFVLPNVQYLDIYKDNPFGTLCPHTWYEKWIGGELASSQSYIFFMLIPILSVLPHSLSLANDRSSGYTYNLFVRGNKKKYYISKYITTFISGGLVVVIPLLINIFLSICTLPSLIPDPSTGTSMIMDNMMWAEFYFEHPNLYIFFYLLIIFAFAGCMAVLGLTIGTSVYNSFMITVMPFIFYLFSYAISTLNNWGKYCPFMYLTPAQRVEDISFSIILTEILLLLSITLFVYIIQMQKDETLN